MDLFKKWWFWVIFIYIISGMMSIWIAKTSFTSLLLLDLELILLGIALLYWIPFLISLIIRSVEDLKIKRKWYSDWVFWILLILFIISLLIYKSSFGVFRKLKTF